MSPFDELLEKATSSELWEVEWNLVISICDLITQKEVQPKYALNCIKKKIFSSDPHISLYALELLNACISNCGKNFHLEVCSREFENDIKKILFSKNSHPKLVEKLKEYLKRWSEQEFKNKSQLSLIPALYNKLKQEGMQFNTIEPTKKISSKLPEDPNVVTSNQEEEDIAKAIELSLKESTPKNYSKQSSTSLYPKINLDKISNYLTNSFDSNQTTCNCYNVRALYDFEAAEDNEITFKAGDIIEVSDDSDLNWWKGWINKREGLFPSNFVTKNLDQEKNEFYSKNNEKKQFNEDIKIKLSNNQDKVTEVDESKIDKLLYLLHEADPTGKKLDLEELIQLEDQCAQMSSLIDQELEKIDKLHASLSTLNSKLVDALNVYCSLIKEDSSYSLLNQSYIQPLNLAQMKTNFLNVYPSNYNEHVHNVSNVPNPVIEQNSDMNVLNPPLVLQNTMTHPVNSYNNAYNRTSLNVLPTATTVYQQMTPYSMQNQQISANSLQPQMITLDGQSMQNPQAQN